MAEVLGRVLRLLERAQDERRERGAAAAVAVMFLLPLRLPAS